MLVARLPWTGLPDPRLPDALARAAGLRRAPRGAVRGRRARPGRPRHRRRTPTRIKDTAVAQPLIVGAGLVSLQRAVPDGPRTEAQVGPTAGHSVGEITAAAFAGCSSDDDAMVFVRERGAGMAAASAVTPTGMSAVLGGDPDEVAAALERARAHPGQRQRRRPDRGRRHPRPAGRPRRRPAGQGPGHPAAGRWRLPHPPHGPGGRGAVRLSAGFATSDPQVPLLSNADGQPSSPAEPTRSTGWCARSAAPCAGTCACRPCSTSASPR